MTIIEPDDNAAWGAMPLLAPPPNREEAYPGEFGPRCPLPVIRDECTTCEGRGSMLRNTTTGELGRWSDGAGGRSEPCETCGGEGRKPHPETCGEPLSLVQNTGLTLDGDGLGYEVPWWQVNCAAGHVLVVPDTEDREVDATPELVAASLAMLTDAAACQRVGLALAALDAGATVEELRSVLDGGASDG